MCGYVHVCVQVQGRGTGTYMFMSIWYRYDVFVHIQGTDGTYMWYKARVRTWACPGNGYRIYCVCSDMDVCLIASEDVSLQYPK